MCIDYSCPKCKHRFGGCEPVSIATCPRCGHSFDVSEVAAILAEIREMSLGRIRHPKQVQQEQKAQDHEGTSQGSS
jgi:Zn-finger nucleic acid-binding protein